MKTALMRMKKRMKVRGNIYLCLFPFLIKSSISMIELTSSFSVLFSVKSYNVTTTNLNKSHRISWVGRDPEGSSSLTTGFTQAHPTKQQKKNHVWVSKHFLNSSSLATMTTSLGSEPVPVPNHPLSEEPFSLYDNITQRFVVTCYHIHPLLTIWFLKDINAEQNSHTHAYYTQRQTMPILSNFSTCLASNSLSKK